MGQIMMLSRIVLAVGGALIADAVALGQAPTPSPAAPAASQLSPTSALSPAYNLLDTRRAAARIQHSMHPEAAELSPRVS